MRRIYDGPFSLEVGEKIIYEFDTERNGFMFWKKGCALLTDNKIYYLKENGYFSSSIQTIPIHSIKEIRFENKFNPFSIVIGFVTFLFWIIFISVLMSMNINPKIGAITVVAMIFAVVKAISLTCRIQYIIISAGQTHKINVLLADKEEIDPFIHEIEKQICISTLNGK